MNLFEKRRERVMKDLNDGSVLVLFSGDNIKNKDVFNVNRNFYYLTGIDEDSVILVMTNIKDRITSTLYILPQDEEHAKWFGATITKNKATEISGIENIQDYYKFEENLFSIIDRMRGYQFINLFFDLWHEDGCSTYAADYANKIIKKYPGISIGDSFPIITSFRLIKDESELACMSQAINTTNLGIQNMMKTIKPNMNEMTLEGLFNFVLFQNNCNETAFKTICASGPRATTLHYQANNQDVKDGELLLIDLGATYKHYCADISRTFPVNGKFTKRQRELYEIVLKAQKIVEENAVVGTNIRKLTEKVVEFYKEELPKHGLTKSVDTYFYHSTSHHIGLDTHDADGGLGLELKAGMVISNEPGLYVADEGIGIRIEDDLLITSTGAQCLSKDIIKTPDEIENFMRNK